ncbi:hypothetical protein [Pseudarthrobacter sp. AB1]|uniref:hypothetical protein n=1 Tax=Pseudarthrobacter sp. AB1 TaxID=2138309 RepID=UPI00186B5A8C|nr:hypothetical protein [Pseudarthrobacter sp. AB1]MBE4720576.1 hypothetical protein [Pseudarthrobacter sp. AB1]
MTLVGAVKAGRVESTDYVQLVNILEDLRTQGAEAMVAAYTEISTLARLYTRVAEVIDPALGLALQTIGRARVDPR